MLSKRAVEIIRELHPTGARPDEPVFGITTAALTKMLVLVGHGDSRHAQFLHSLDEFLDVAGAVEHRVVGMQVQVNELGHGFFENRLRVPGSPVAGFQG